MHTGRRVSLKNQPPLNVLLLVLAPCVFLIVATFVIGDSELFLLVNRGMVNLVLDIACVYGSPTFFSAFYLYTLAKLRASHRRKFAIAAVLSVVTGLVSYGSGSVLKLVVMKPRPFEVLDGVRVIGPWDTSSFSFPSTTTMLAFGFAVPMLLLFEKRTYGILLSFLSYFIGFSVIYAGFHFPADVIAGVLFSIAIALGTSRLGACMTS
jgi:membrane-associated phospholipid phosphatase